MRLVNGSTSSVISDLNYVSNHFKSTLNEISNSNTATVTVPNSIVHRRKLPSNGHVNCNGQVNSLSDIPPPPATYTDDHSKLYESPPLYIALLCYFSYVVLILFGYFRDFLRSVGLEKNMAAVESNREGYPRLYKNFESFYTRNIYRRIRDAWNVPICSVPGATIDVIDRTSPDYNWSFE